MIALRALLFAVFVAALWLSIGLARAEEPRGDGTGTALHPGVNLVGWVGEATSVSQIFREIPQLESVWAWDSQLDKWLVAGRDTPPGLDSLKLLTAGMGLRLHIGGEEPVVWRRSSEPTRGLVRLWTGWNLVAWSGPDDAPLEQVAKGIGWSLRSVRRWDAANQQWMAWTSPERSAQLIADSGSHPKAGMQRGEALWVEVARAVNWLQPTGILPRIEFQEGVSEEARTRIRQDLQTTLSYFGERYGIQADPALNVFVHLWHRFSGSAADQQIDLNQSAGRGTVVHEYFHILQAQLSGSRFLFRDFVPRWLVEGSAEWAKLDSTTFEGGNLLESPYLWSLAASATGGGPVSLRFDRLIPIHSTELNYVVGETAAGRLAAKAGADSWVEFWRRLAPNNVPDHPRWTSSLDWRIAFHEVFGISLSNFSAEFEVWRPDAIQGLLRNVLDLSAEADATQDRGGAVQGGDDTTADAQDLRWNDLTPGWSDDWKNELAQYFAGLVGSDDVTEGVLATIRYYIETIVNFDGWRLDAALASDDAPSIRGHVTDSVGDPVSGAVVLALRTDGEVMSNRVLHAKTTEGGQFDLRLPGFGEYRLGVDIGDGCALHVYDNGELVQAWPWYAAWRQAKSIRIDAGTVRRVDFALPADACGRKIQGRVVDSSGEPLSGVRVGACSATRSRNLVSRNRRCSSVSPTMRFWTASDGSFAVTVETTGEYNLELLLGIGASGEACLVYYHTSGATTARDRATAIAVERADVSDITITVPATLCRWQITGKIAGAGDRLRNGADIFLVPVLEQQEEHILRAVQIGRDSSFAVTVPGEGTYRLDNVLFLVGDGICGPWPTDRERRTGESTVRVERGDAYLEWSVPAGLCEQWIRGSISGTTGDNPIFGFVSACKMVGGRCAESGSSRSLRATNGWFYIPVPSSGAYSLSLDQGDGCTIWFTTEGFTTNPEERSTFHVEEGDLQLGARQVPEDICAGQ